MSLIGANTAESRAASILSGISLLSCTEMLFFTRCLFCFFWLLLVFLSGILLLCWCTHLHTFNYITSFHITFYSVTGLQFSDDMQNSTTSSLSGGWRMRVALAGALFIEPDLLMLDEVRVGVCMCVCMCVYACVWVCVCVYVCVFTWRFGCFMSAIEYHFFCIWLF